MSRRALALLVLALFVGGAAAAALATWISRQANAPPTIGGPFALLDGRGKRVTDADFRGRYMLVYFGYTHCPDACPTTLNDIAAALDLLPTASRARVVPVFITVDPARDTPSVIGDYAHAFGSSFVGLSGPADAIANVEQEYHVYAAKSPLKGGDYAMDHSSILYLMGPDGRFVSALPDEAKPADLASSLRSLGL